MFETGRTVRFLAWACAAILVWAICLDSASAQGIQGAVIEEAPVDDGFFINVFRSIFLLDTKGLMATLGKPHYAISAFIVL
ncbi:MAG: hypothetical protein HYR84_10300, partial [Planctomycetes bacterium]|nr:hypothetical protein [Planctomycetota bacterium]